MNKMWIFSMGSNGEKVLISARFGNWASCRIRTAAAITSYTRANRLRILIQSTLDKRELLARIGFSAPPDLQVMKLLGLRTRSA